MRSILFLFAWCRAEPAHKWCASHAWLLTARVHIYSTSNIIIRNIQYRVYIYTANILLLDTNPSVF